MVVETALYQQVCGSTRKSAKMLQITKVGEAFIYSVYLY